MYISINTIRELGLTYYDYQEAKELYLSDKIIKLKATKEDKDTVIVKGTFESDNIFRRNNIDCLLRIDLQSNQVGRYCDCPESTRYHYVCRHCLALFLYVNEIDFNKLPFDYSEHRIQLFKARTKFYDHLVDLANREILIQKTENLLNPEDDNVYEIQPYDTGEQNYIYVNMSQNDRYNLYLSFKLGNKKSYAIKSLPTFIKALDQNNIVSYGKNLSFRHNNDAFDERCLDAIKLIRHLVSLEDITFKGGRIILSNENLPVIFNYLKNYPKELTNINLNQIKEPLYLNVSAGKESEYIITHPKTSDNYFLTKEGFFTVEETNNIFTIDFYDVINSNNTLNMLRLLYEDDKLLLFENQIKPFFYKFVKPLKGKIEFIDYPSVGDKSENKITLTGTINDMGNIEFSMNCQYDDNTQKNPLKDNAIYSAQVNKVMNTLKSYSQISEEKDKFILDSEKNETKEFMQSILPQINKDIEVFLSDSLLNFGKKQKYSFKIGLTYHNDLLHLNISGNDFSPDELSNILRAYQRKQKYYRLKDGDTISLYSDDLKQLNELMDNYGISAKDLKKEDITLNPYRAFALDKEKEKNLTIERTTQFKNFLNNFAQIEDDNFTIAEKYNDILRDYQKFGIQWLHHLKKLNFGGILADDMGLGKTLEIIALLESEQASLSIVICPASLILNWDDELKKFHSNLKALPIYGNKEHRNKLISQANNYDLLITSYDYIRNDIDKYEQLNFDTIILDEAQYIKNQKTKNAESVKLLKGKHKFALTGTPIENSLAELWSIFDFLMPGYLFTYNYFRSHFETAIINNDDNRIKERLKNMISPFILRRNKKDVLTELPDKQEHTIVIDFTDEERKIYVANLIQVNQQLQQELKSEKFDKIAVLAMITKLRLICGDRRLVYSNVTEPSSKINGCIELIQTLKENNKKALLFSSFTSALDLIEEELIKNNITYYKLTGATKKETRKEMVESFQKGDVDIFLISLKAGGTGLNLTAAEAVIHFDPWWNISAQNQATDRAYRIGQHNNVQIYKMIMKDSIEERILTLQEKKKELSDLFIEGNEGNVMKMDKKDFEELLSYK